MLAACALFPDACTPIPSTGPAHASLWTGLHPRRHAVLDNAVPLGSGVPTVGERGRAAGIATAAFVSSYILAPRFGFARGFETFHFEPNERYLWRGREHKAFWTRGDATTDAALAWLRDQRRESFLLWVHYFDPHAPYKPPPGFERTPSEPVSIDGKLLPPGVPSFAHLTDMIRGYRGDVAYTDAALSRLLAGLRSLDLFDSTAIVVTSDHGEGLGDHGLLEHGANLFEELVRVPLLVRGPGIAQGQRLYGPAQLEDLAPTLLELLKLPVPPGLDGRSLLPWLRGAVATSPRDAVVGRRKPTPGDPDLFSTRRDGRKWIGDGPGREYQLDRDPHEDAGEVAAVPRAIAAIEGAARAPAAAPVLDPESRRALEALGYLEP
jgi:arylsulfatase A-like enzyme